MNGGGPVGSESGLAFPPGGSSEKQEPPTVFTPPPVAARPPQPRDAAGSRTESESGSESESETPRRRRRVGKVLRFLILLVVLPVLAVALGILVAWVVHQFRGAKAAPAASTPSASATPSPSKPAVSPSASAAARVVVPASWVTQQVAGGLTFRHPAGWLTRSARPESLSFAPMSAGSLTPGIDGVGAGVEQAAGPSQALADFAFRTYGGEPGYVAGAARPVTAAAHPGEQQMVITYRRAGVPVQVVARSFRIGNRTVLVLGRGAVADPRRAALLESIAEASLRVSG